MNTLPDLSQLTHEQLLEFTRQLAMQHQSLAQSKQQLEQSNQQLDSKVQHLSILNQKYEHELALFKKHKFGSKNEHLTAKQIHLWDEAVEEEEYIAHEPEGQSDDDPPADPVRLGGDEHGRGDEEESKG